MTKKYIKITRHNEKKLKRGLTPFSVWAMAFGCIVGWGAFLMPGDIFLKQAGPLGSMFAIEIGAFIMLIISYCYYYMLHRFPEVGAQFMYAKKAFGKLHGFICAWFLGFCYISIIPLNATALQTLLRTIADNLLQFGFHYNFRGYDVYLGEILLAITALIVFALISSLNIRRVGQIQVALVLIQLCVVLVMVVGSIMNPGHVLHENLGPLFHPGKDLSIFLQMFSVIAVAPWAFVGFEIVPQLSHESNFSMEGAKVIMDTCILCSAFFYIVLTLMAALAIPVGYSTWVEYIYGLPYLRGMASVPTAFAAHRLMGGIGSVLWSVASLSAAFSCIIGFYIATSRLLYNMAKDAMIPSWFGKLTRHGVPVNATIFCMLFSMIPPFFGRSTLTWAVEMSAIGGAIGFGYTSLAARKYAREEGRMDIEIFGTLGFIFSIFFAMLLLIPFPKLNCSIGQESWLLLVLWTVMGIIFFLRTQVSAPPEDGEKPHLEGAYPQKVL
ncbi:MAG: APC family permease [Fretibacterium sp.]|nr:APC family permease [Fretibacterium sp.]